MKGQSGSGWVELEVWKAHKIICCRQSAVEVKSFYSNHLEDILDGRHDPCHCQPISLRSTNVRVPLLDQNPGDAWKRFLLEMVDKTVGELWLHIINEYWICLLLPRRLCFVFISQWNNLEKLSMNFFEELDVWLNKTDKILVSRSRWGAKMGSCESFLTIN